MDAAPELSTARLLLRRWRPSDLEPFAALNADPTVMEYFPATLSRAESDAIAERADGGLAARGFGLWAAELRGEGFIGFVGLTHVDPALAFAPAVEVAWRLARPFWGRGLAFEAATAVVRFGLRDVGLASLLAYTAAANTRSRRLMGRLQMRRDPGEDFEHPLLPAHHPLSHHVIHRTSNGPDGRDQNRADGRRPPR